MKVRFSVTETFLIRFSRNNFALRNPTFIENWVFPQTGKRSLASTAFVPSDTPFSKGFLIILNISDLF